MRTDLSDHQRQIVSAGFARHTKEQAAPAFKKERLSWLVYADDELLVGVLTVDLLWDWIYIDELWVDEGYRDTGIGKRLMKQAEDYAISHNLSGLWLWTQSWQAAKFYSQLGYQEFTRFSDFPKGHYRIGFRKQISISR